MTFEQFLTDLLNNFGFPVFVTAILLYDKIKSNGSLKKAVENNTQILRRIEDKIK